jgi:hypothetical protein
MRTMRVCVLLVAALFLNACFASVQIGAGVQSQYPAERYLGITSVQVNNAVTVVNNHTIAFVDVYNNCSKRLARIERGEPPRTVRLAGFRCPGGTDWTLLAKGYSVIRGDTVAVGWQRTQISSQSRQMPHWDITYLQVN